MKNFQIFTKRLFRLRNLASVLSITAAVLGGIFASDAELQTRLLLIAVGILGVDAIAERLDILSNIEEQVVSTSKTINEVRNTVQETEVTVFLEDRKAIDKVLGLTSMVPVSKVEILSSGLISRQDLVISLLKKNIRVISYVQDPVTALDPKDKERVQIALDMIHRESPNVIKDFNLWFHINISTVRAIVLHESLTDVKHIFLSWYFYTHNNSRVFGSQNPSIYCSTHSKQGEQLYGWLSETIERTKAESHRVDLKDMIDD